MAAENTQVSLCICADSHKPPLLDNVMRAKILFADLNIFSVIKRSNQVSIYDLSASAQDMNSLCEHMPYV